MSPFLRKVKTTSGATAVQIVEKQGRRNVMLEHLGSAHTDAELAALLQVGRDRLHAGQQALDLGLDTEPAEVGESVITSKTSARLLQALRVAWERLGFTCVDDDAFYQLVLARLVEPTSMIDTGRVVTSLGQDAVHVSTLKRSFKRALDRDYRGQIASACFNWAISARAFRCAAQVTGSFSTPVAVNRSG